MSETYLKASKKGNYIQIDYVTNIEIPSTYNKYVWCINVKMARLFINKVKEIETHVKQILIKECFNYDFRLIMTLHLNAIESISSGIDIRSNMSSEDLANRFVYGYDKRYKEAFKICNETIDYVDKIGKFHSYMKDWRRYEKHNNLVNEFKLPCKKLNIQDFLVDELKSIENSLDNILNYFK